MSFNFSLKYRTFDELLADVQSDFSSYHLANYIEPQQLIRLTKKVNYELGLRIQSTKETVLEIEKGRCRLPLNFNSLNFAFLCGEYTEKFHLPQGTYVEERPLGVDYKYQPNEILLCDNPIAPVEPVCNTCQETSCGCPSQPVVQLDCKGNEFQLVQILKYQTRTYDFVQKIKLIANPMEIECDCPNLYWESPFTAWIKDGFIYTNFDSGKLYMNYQALMEDEHGNLLVPDHDLINEYYEYSLKKRIVENLIMNDETVTQLKIQLIEQRFREARNAAISLVKTPNFEEIHKIWQANRKAQRNRYSNMFKGGWTNNRLGRNYG